MRRRRSFGTFLYRMNWLIMSSCRRCSSAVASMFESVEVADETAIAVTSTDSTSSTVVEMICGSVSGITSTAVTPETIETPQKKL